VGHQTDRRRFLAAALAAAGATVLRPRGAVADGEPAVPASAASGDVTGGRAVVWARAERPSRVLVEWSPSPSLADARRLSLPPALAGSDLTTRAVLRGLPAGQRLTYRVRFDPLDGGAAPAPVTGTFRTAPASRGGVSFVWGADVAGQGWGIDPARGGYAIFDAMRAVRPDLFIHSGDSIYADNPILPEKRLDDGTFWRNVTTAAKSKVAETLDEFRGNHRYNLLDGPLRAFRAEVPSVMQWDDHEVLNNWYPGERLDDARYAVKDVSLLAARARRAFLEHAPIVGERIHRVIHYGPSLDVFVLDLRGYRSANDANRTPAAHILGREQLAWLRDALKASRATWKVMACDMPIGLAIPDGEAFEAVANGDPGPPLGREREIAGVLEHIARARIRNVVWVTGDVHYAAAHHYHPDRAAFKAFDPFWEFVAGPLHAGTFLPTPLDATFGPEVKFQSVPADMKPNRPPSDGLQFFGRGAIAPGSEVLTVSLHDRGGRALYSLDLAPVR
jgi:alkaline phosphatase D